ncbi:ABC transporter permease subunit [Occultella gossypii]|uniref:ABC transporter permease subunit n=1 Tax=Occultella gossypii TaxID=2800820 RepID=A0ABS7S9U0_9MICO|nr:ABC transporter permease subunit [Occultella gossypii]MBZ2197118.1 ABC transporter permease subunit [Occultella gossypii]
MTATTSTPRPTTQLAPSVRPARPLVPARLDFAGVLAAEWRKLFSLRSTWWTLGLTVVLLTLMALGQAAAIADSLGSPEGAAVFADVHGAELVTGGYQFGMLTIAVLGALLITGEYSTGMIRSTFAAVPTRLPVLAAKALALSVLTVITTAVGFAAAYAATMPILSEHDLVPSLTDGTTWQIAGGATAFLVAAALFALGVGTLLRSTAGAVTVALTVLLLLPGILQFITLDWVQTLVEYLPLPAATAFVTVSEAFGGTGGFTPWQGAAVVAAWALVPMIAAAVVLRRRDA